MLLASSVTSTPTSIQIQTKVEIDGKELLWYTAGFLFRLCFVLTNLAPMVGLATCSSVTINMMLVSSLLKVC